MIFFVFVVLNKNCFLSFLTEYKILILFFFLYKNNVLLYNSLTVRENFEYGFTILVSLNKIIFIFPKNSNNRTQY